MNDVRIAQLLEIVVDEASLVRWLPKIDDLAAEFAGQAGIDFPASLGKT